MQTALPRSIWIAVLAGSLLAGCARNSPPPSASANLVPPGGTPATNLIGAPAGEYPPLPAATLDIQIASIQSETPTALPTQSLDPTFTPPASRKEIKAGLEASDPSQVQLASGEIQLVEFFAYWCGVCRNLAPTVHELEAAYSERMNFIYLDIDDSANDPFKEALGYQIQPHLFLIDEHGKIIREWLGRASEADLRQAIEDALN